MRAVHWSCVIGAALLALPQAAAAQGITYDCDTAADHFSELDLPAGSGAFSVSGKVQLSSLGVSKNYAPVARIQVAAPSAPGTTPTAYAGFSLVALATDPGKTPSGASSIQMLGWTVNGKDDEILPLSTLTKPGTVQPFTMTYDGNGMLSISLGTETKSFPLKVTAPVVRVACSTGEFLFTDLTITPQR